MASSKTADAGPSGSKGSSKKQRKAQTPEPAPAKSSEMIIDSESEESSEESVDSDDDIEKVLPKKKEVQANAGASRGKTLPKYAPPHGMIKASVNATFKDSPFEYEQLNDPSLQLWTIRVPADFKPSRLSALTFTPPTSSTGPSGTLKYKSTSYTLQAAGEPGSSKAVVDEEGRQPTAGSGAADVMAMDAEELRAEGGEEMGGMRLLVPKLKDGGSLVVAPIPVTHHLLLTPQLDDNPVETGFAASYLSETAPDGVAPVAMEGVLPSKRKQPTHLLKFRNRAFGFDTPGPAATRVEVMETDGAEAEVPMPGEVKKKRKSEGKEVTPKKKKAKA